MGRLYGFNFGRGFSGTFDTDLLFVEIEAFFASLSLFYSDLKGEAEFSTIEGQLEFKLTANALGQVLLTGFAEDLAGGGNRLEFTIKIDQSYLGQTIAELSRVIEYFKSRRLPKGVA